MRAQPRGLSRRRVQQLLAKAKSNRSAGTRIDVLSRCFLGLPYTTDLLIGSVETPELFTISLDSFDCVTYVETVLALSRASSVDEFVDWLRKIRYSDGRVQWERRNHYMTGWIRNNVRIGAVRRVSANVRPVAKQRTLDGLPGLPPQKARFGCIPKASLKRFSSDLRTGDMIFFVSIRKHRDVFHCGILVSDGDRLRMRHAARSRGGVVEQDLDEFLKDNRMAGVIIVRPTEE